jgi:hypothetical protein
MEEKKKEKKSHDPLFVVNPFSYTWPETYPLIFHFGPHLCDVTVCSCGPDSVGVTVLV